MLSFTQMSPALGVPLLLFFRVRLLPFELFFGFSLYLSRISPRYNARYRVITREALYSRYLGPCEKNKPYVKPRYNTHVNAIISAKTIHVGIGSPVFLFLFEVFSKVVILCGCIPKHRPSFTSWEMQELCGAKVCCAPGGSEGAVD